MNDAFEFLAQLIFGLCLSCNHHRVSLVKVLCVHPCSLLAISLNCPALLAAAVPFFHVPQRFLVFVDFWYLDFGLFGFWITTFALKDLSVVLD